jgi:hypothetical protein
MLFSEDPEWREEAEAAARAGFDVITIDEHALETHDATTFGRLPIGSGPILRRGPELSVDAHGRLDAGLSRRGWQLVPGFAAWQAVHLVPSAERRIGALLDAPSRSTRGFATEPAWRHFGGFRSGVIVHDHVSPCAQPADGMAWVPAGADRASFDAALAEVLTARGDRATGGFVLRRPIVLVATAPGETPTEPLTRLVCWKGRELLTGMPLPLARGGSGVDRLVARLDVPFVAIDIAFDITGRPSVIGVDEAGDVALPADTDLDGFYRRLRIATA